MASKSSPAVAAPPQISLADHVLSSRISLPPDPCVSYTRFIPDPSSSIKPHHSIELARRDVLSKHSSTVLLESALSSVHIGPSPFMYVFFISAQDRVAIATSMLATLQFDGLTVDETSFFALKDLYPCSPACSLLREPCHACLDRDSSRNSSSTCTLLPRRPLRLVYSHFLEAIRIRLLDDIAKASAQDVPSRTPRPVKRLKGGFLLGSPPSATEWGSDWDYHALSRPLLYCQLQVHLSNSPQDQTRSLIIHPLLLTTPFLPLANFLPLPRGTPITLLPHGTPAFFLTHYSGPTSALKKQFQESLQGLGVSGWETPPSSGAFAPNGDGHKPEFIIAWISVENKQGEDKGIILVYPTALCLTLTPSAASGFPARPPLDYLPELPAPLQPSPQVPAAKPTLLQPGSATMPGATSPLPSRPSSPSTIAFVTPPTAPSYTRPALPSSPTSDSVRAFRALTLSKSKDIRRVAAEVGGYVDAVLRERERERERLKRQRENGASSSPRLARTAATTPAAPTPSTTAATDTPTPLLASQHNVAPSPSPAPQPAAGPSQQLQHSTPTQNFYPSPPQTNPPIVPIHAGQTSPSTGTSALPTVAPTTTHESTSAIPAPLPAAAANAAPALPASTTFDPFGSTEAAWAIQPQTYLGINMDMDMDFDMGMGMDMGFGMNSASRGSAYGGGGSTGMDFDDSAFTDDDFSFFDRPSAPASATGLHTSLPLASSPPRASRGGAVNSNAGGTGLTAATAQTPMGVNASSPLFGDVHFSGTTPRQAPTPQTCTLNSSPWVPGTLAEGFTPRYTDTDPHAALPDLVPPSPGPTPPSHSAPSTPTVHLESDPAIRRPSVGPSTFDPIPFAAYHRALDGKYAVGKFSLPSPPDEEDRTEPLNLGVSYYSKSLGTAAGPGATNNNGWRFKYMAATDPRIGVVRKLIGVKRKMTFEQGAREMNSRGGGTPKMSPSWIREHEDWEKNTRADAVDAVGGAPDDNDDRKSDAESDDDMDDARDESESPVVSRPSTPLPAYLPLGPTLLHTQFQHSELLPLSTPLRPPGAAVAPTNITTATQVASVPTPASPAATLAEKSKSLEAAAYTVAREVVENPPWAEAWRASTLAGSKRPGQVWLADVQTIVRLFEDVPAVEGPLDLGTLFGFPPQEKIPTKSDSARAGTKPLQMLEAPLISAAKGDAIIQILPTAVRFWEKLGLGPKGGQKNGTAFVLFEEDGEQRQQQVETWLASVVATYEGKHLGTMALGKSPSCPKDGLFPLRFDSSFRKNLGSLVASLPAYQTSLIFFIVTPLSTLTLASPILRQVFSAVKKAAKTYSEAQIHFQFVPEQLIQGHLGNPAADFSDLEVLCYSVYNRILVAVDRSMSRRFFEHGERVRRYFQEPAITLARPVYPKASFVRSAHASLDVMDRDTFLHVGYQVSQCGKWILAACVDQRGEAHDLGVWMTQTPGEGESEEVPKDVFVVKKIWEFAVQFAKKAALEWRIVFARLGVMGEGELDAWANLLEVHCRGLRMASATVLSAELEAPWTFCSSRPPSKATPTKTLRSSTSKNQPQNIFTDISTTYYALTPHNALPQSHPPTLTDLGLSLSLIPESQHTPASPGVLQQEQQNGPASALPHPLALLPRSSTTLICLPATPSPTAITMLHIHLLHTIRPPASATTQEDIPALHTAITRNFHELAVLATTRSRLGVSPALPYHLAAVEAMRIALDRDQYGMDAADSP
ncbi:putative component of the SRB8-11 complex [Lyophyllum shimeji]|uniref:Mediator of RNA polymerase II transcription subunit 13 n=1 Tax=Lyophyllum shimeji TaxID=47721 RepID=A0A9P3UHP4_LYOSH|nr:putative component of the SRB8-11 complex [Lyophyllum shimeji]